MDYVAKYLFIALYFVSIGCGTSLAIKSFEKKRYFAFGIYMAGSIYMIVATIFTFFINDF